MYGLYFGYENNPQSIFTHSNNVGSLEKKNYTVAVEYGKRYFDLNWLQLFFNGGLGITYIDEMLSEKEPTNIKTKSKFVLAYHVNALGVRIGYIVYLNISLGYGYRGILNVGLSYQF